MTLSSPLAKARQAWAQAPLPHRLALILVLLFYLFQVSIYFNFTEDDPGISFRYAAHLAEGHGLVYNHGDRVEGYSNFGFVAVLAFLYKFVLWGYRPGMILLVKFINLGVGALCLWLVWRIGRDFMHWPRWLGLAAVLVTASFGPFAIAVASPLETLTLAAWLLLALWLTMDYLTREAPTARQALGVGLTWLMLALWRIDAPLLVAMLGLFFVIHRGIRWKKQDLVLLAAPALGYALYTLFRYLYFGDILPNTFYAKVNLGNDWRHPYPYLVTFMDFHGGKLVVYVTLILALLRWRGAAMAAALVFSANALYVNKVGGDWMTGYRFFAPVTPLLALVYGDAAFRLWQIVTGLGGERLRRVLKPLAWAAIPLGLAGLLFLFTKNGIWIYEMGSAKVGGGRNAFAFYKHPSLDPHDLTPYSGIARWIAANTPPTAKMVLQEGGFIPYLADRHTIDTFGLCNYQLGRVIKGKRKRLGLYVYFDRPETPAMQYILGLEPELLLRVPWKKPDLPPTAAGDRYQHIATFFINAYGYGGERRVNPPDYGALNRERWAGVYLRQGSTATRQAHFFAAPVHEPGGITVSPEAEVTGNPLAGGAFKAPGREAWLEGSLPPDAKVGAFFLGLAGSEGLLAGSALSVKLKVDGQWREVAALNERNVTLTLDGTLNDAEPYLQKRLDPPLAASAVRVEMKGHGPLRLAGFGLAPDAQGLAAW